MVLLEAFGGLFTDINLLLKLSALVMIISFVQQNLGKGWLALGVIGIITYFALFVNWGIFGSVYFVYVLLMAGVSGLVIDFFFASHAYQQYDQEKKARHAQKHGGGMMGPEGPDMPGAQMIKERQHQTHQSQFVPRPQPPPPPG